MERPAADLATAAQFRSAQRARLTAAREALEPAEHGRLSTRVAQHLEWLLARLEPRILGFCWPYRGEFDVRPLVTRRAGLGMRAALPEIAGPDLPMRFREWRPETALRPGHFGIPVPVDGDTLAPDVILMPAVGFDAAGFRLGYGGGFFDRTLAAMRPRPLAVGTGFELARLDSIRPGVHDLPMDYMVTERGVLARGDAGLEPMAGAS
ncbi:MAG: 5-formyltetrahydrofolate cyclo-ligase [Betaproteobacteria bacterium]|nr:5-formyltetrahydrofolate cyclo-ligase [Betaproteobacteria bacterium]